MNKATHDSVELRKLHVPALERMLRDAERSGNEQQAEEIREVLHVKRRKHFHRRTKSLSIRVSEEELHQLHVNATAAELPLSEYVIRQCLSRETR